MRTNDEVLASLQALRSYLGGATAASGGGGGGADGAVERLGLEMHDRGMARVVPEPLESGGVKSVLAPPDDEEASELVSPDALLNLVGFLLVSYVGGQLLSALASSIDVEQMANSVR